MFIPNWTKLFGTAYKRRVTADNHHNIYITKTHLKAVDQPSRRCNSETTSPDTTACMARFIEKQIGCSPDIMGSQYPTGIPCHKEKHLDGLANITRMMENADENEVYEMTGCLSACTKHQYIVDADPTQSMLYGRGKNVYSIKNCLFNLILFI